MASEPLSSLWHIVVAQLVALIKAAPPTDLSLEWTRIALGVALLLLGRKLFWIFVSGVGFLAGSMLAAEVFGAHSPVTIIIVAAIFGVIGALLSLFLQKVAIAAAGFGAGMYVAASLINHSIFATSSWSWLIVLVSGILGAVLTLFLFDWSLIIISSLTGAIIIIDAIRWPSPELAVGIFFALTVLGIGIQFTLLRRPPAKLANPPG